LSDNARRRPARNDFVSLDSTLRSARRRPIRSTKRTRGRIPALESIDGPKRRLNSMTRATATSPSRSSRFRTTTSCLDRNVSTLLPSIASSQEAGTFWADLGSYPFAAGSLLFFVPYQAIRLVPETPVRGLALQFQNFLCIETLSRGGRLQRRPVQRHLRHPIACPKAPRRPGDCRIDRLPPAGNAGRGTGACRTLVVVSQNRAGQSHASQA
jgi:hypothetical protein